MADTTVAIIGAGPAGLTAAYLLSKKKVPVTVLEADPEYVGGISRTAKYKGFHFDIGGHRFFSKSQEVEDFWTEILPNDMLVRPRFEQREFDRVRDLRLNRLLQLKDMPPALADRAFTQLLYRNHPYGHLPIGSEGALRSLVIRDIVAFHRRAFRPSRTTVIAVGDASAAALTTAVRNKKHKIVTGIELSQVRPRTWKFLAAMVPQHGRKRPRPIRLPKKSVQLQVPALKSNFLRLWLILGKREACSEYESKEKQMMFQVRFTELVIG